MNIYSKSCLDTNNFMRESVCKRVVYFPDHRIGIKKDYLKASQLFNQTCGKGNNESCKYDQKLNKRIKESD
ncbi:hypothetical protein BKH45_02495 [Helicobacter sp. 11S03491-1]|nr:hypothetical protein BKH45_02495 [Helicobacter sp. 11S03491-1]